jgi:hypothetical protein
MNCLGRRSQDLFIILMFMSLVSRIVPAQSPPAVSKVGQTKFPETQADRDAVENPVVFRLVQLAVVETSLKAVDEALAKAGHKSNYMANKAEQAENKNITMDQLGGGPVAWDKFYGKTANQFFSGPADGRRPAQFDYVYRANEKQTQRAKEEVAALAGKIDKLLERKRQLERDQVALWGQISSSLVAQRELGDRPIYSYRLRIDGTETDESLAQRVAAVEAFAQYLRVLDRTADYFGNTISKDQALAFAALKQNVEAARKSLLHDVAIVDSDIRGRTDALADLAKRLAVVTNSAAETRDTAMKADASDDEARKMSSRELLQTAMIDFADKAAQLDDGIVKLAADWNIKPATDKPLREIKLIEVSTGRQTASSVQPPTDSNKTVDARSAPKVTVPANSNAEGSELTKKRVTLKAPYPASYQGAPTNRLSVQYAVKEISKQAGVDYDFQKSQANIGELARRWVTPNIVDMQCDQALEGILSPLGIAFDVEDNKIILRRK